MKTIAFMQQKGGVAKSTSTAALAYDLNAVGKNVLVMDADPQQNLSFIMGANVLEIDGTLYDVWKGTRSITEVIQSVRVGIDLITGGLALASADFEFSGTVGREQLLKRCLADVSGYDYILIDCPPSLGLLTMTAATAADDVIIPMCVDILSIQGMTQLFDFLDSIKEYCNASLSVAGILLTVYDDTVLTTKGLESQIQEIADSHGIKVFDTRIHKAQAIKTAQARQDFDIFGKRSRAATDYRSFTAELLTMYEGSAE